MPAYKCLRCERVSREGTEKCKCGVELVGGNYTIVGSHLITIDGPIFTGRPMPRDPKRIPDILIELQQAWEKSPDLRLGQLLVSIYSKNRPSPTPEDTLSGIFYTEDDKWLEMIEKEVS